MENKIQELTDKIYREGVEKGNEEALRLIDDAKAEAQKIIADAKKEADSFLANSRKSSEELKANTHSEIKLFAGQAVSALKAEIANIITDRIVKEGVNEFTSQKDFLGQFIVSLASKWSSSEALVIETNDAEALKKYFFAHAKSLLDKGVTIEQVNGNKTLFTISPANGAYKVNFGEEEFINYFKEYLRPQLVEILFDK